MNLYLPSYWASKCYCSFICTSVTFTFLHWFAVADSLVCLRPANIQTKIKIAGFLIYRYRPIELRATFLFRNTCYTLMWLCFSDNQWFQPTGQVRLQSLCLLFPFYLMGFIATQRRTVPCVLTTSSFECESLSSVTTMFLIFQVYCPSSQI